MSLSCAPSQVQFDFVTLNDRFFSSYRLSFITYLWGHDHDVPQHIVVYNRNEQPRLLIYLVYVEKCHLDSLVLMAYFFDWNIASFSRTEHHIVQQRKLLNSIFFRLFTTKLYLVRYQQQVTLCLIFDAECYLKILGQICVLNK